MPGSRKFDALEDSTMVMSSSHSVLVNGPARWAARWTLFALLMGPMLAACSKRKAGDIAGCQPLRDPSRPGGIQCSRAEFPAQLTFVQEVSDTAGRGKNVLVECLQQANRSKAPSVFSRNAALKHTLDLDTDGGTASVPAAAVPARRKDLAGLPPAFIGVGSIDLFCNEDMRYAERLAAAGIETELSVVPGAFHGFDLIAPQKELARSFVATKMRAVRRAFSGDL